MSTPIHENSADFVNESYRQYGDTIDSTYIDGYDPMSLNAPHSSLEKGSTWVGMGIWVASLAFAGIWIHGLGMVLWGSGSVNWDPTPFLIIGGVGLISAWIIGYLLIRSGRREYKEYRKRTGRHN
ncbi:hypothetical protein [Corynebacterium guangdongense]|uniref:DUF2530 domain-containing protein n=1 Tax=Corynebacterium guangdongense TaxID=1783348 RepID=A0ABU2A114_9CORY|nr:hypothetical protein [Corynebacterium guangdongense]MDR7330870.1 hypothetical protein [Corynebacterium guangdongense]WJZ16885.1 hypothetical protein CGUA_01425 [Corynebacterium guangdongense]